jgi:hypothetical protein
MVRTATPPTTVLGWGAESVGDHDILASSLSLPKYETTRHCRAFKIVAGLMMLFRQRTRDVTEGCHSYPGGSPSS